MSAPWLPETRNKKVGRSHNSSSPSKKERTGSKKTPDPQRRVTEFESGKINTTTPIFKLKLELQDVGSFSEMGNVERLESEAKFSQGEMGYMEDGL